MPAEHPKPSFLVLMLVFSVDSACGQSAQAWRSDLRFMAAQMERTHKDLYHSISHEQFAAEVAALNDQIPRLQRHQVIVAMEKIVASVGDGHTNIYPTRDPRIGFHTLPVAFTFFNGDLYIRAAHQSEASLLGAKVLKIGDSSLDASYQAAETLIGHENEQGLHYWAE